MSEGKRFRSSHLPPHDRVAERPVLVVHIGVFVVARDVKETQHSPLHGPHETLQQRVSGDLEDHLVKIRRRRRDLPPATGLDRPLGSLKRQVRRGCSLR